MRKADSKIDYDLLFDYELRQQALDKQAAEHEYEFYAQFMQCLTDTIDRYVQRKEVDSKLDLKTFTLWRRALRVFGFKWIKVVVTKAFQVSNLLTA